MPLILEQQAKSSIPIDAQSLSIERLRGLNSTQVAQKKISIGNQLVEVGELFLVSGSLDEDETIEFSGDVTSVHQIGAQMNSGTIIINGNAGRRVGARMCGGSIVVHGNAADYLGMAMTGGQIQVHGHAAGHVGAKCPGTAFGMNRGSILIAGNVGENCGSGMRRGTIAVGGNSGNRLAANILAGTVLVFGKAGSLVGANMKRGTIVVCENTAGQLAENTAFAHGRAGRYPILNMMANWLEQQPVELPASKLRGQFTLLHGDRLNGSRGELFVSVSTKEMNDE